MTFSSALRSFSEGYDDGRLSGNALPQRILGGAAFACVALACAWTLWANLAGTQANQVIAFKPSPPRAARPSSLANAYAKLAAAMRRHAPRSVLANDYAALLDPHYLLGFAPGTFSAGVELAADGREARPGFGRFTTAVAADVSSTLSRADRLVHSVASALPRLHASQTRTASVRDRPERETETPAAPQMQTASLPDRPQVETGKPTIFQRLFGKPFPALSLAYASPTDGTEDDGQSGASGRYDRWTAVYDISAHTVYMPDGTTLEAHSGLGRWLDDPTHVDEKSRGATPPDVYDLELREGLFHGVQALRLIPVDDKKVFGRTGLLAHTYMLGPKGDSFGCVSFRNYKAFLQAYLAHRIKRLIVVAGRV